MGWDGGRKEEKMRETEKTNEEKRRGEERSETKRREKKMKVSDLIPGILD